MIRVCLSRQWFLTTLIVIAAIAVMVRLGIWQLDRLEQRRMFNARVEAQIDQPLLDLNTNSLGEDLPGMEYRSVSVTGEYDHAQQVAIRNQVWENRPGVHLMTPLLIDGSNQAVLVDRGWIPAEDMPVANWVKYNEPGPVEIRGVIRQSRDQPDIGRNADTDLASQQGRLDLWRFVDITRIQEQTTYSLLPVYIQQAPDPDWDQLPYRTQPELDLTDGPHLGYAGQWFLFAAVLAIGYPFYLIRQNNPTRFSDNQPYESKLAPHVGKTTR